MAAERRVAIVDYGMGNLRSVANALDELGADSIVTGNPAEIEGVAAIIVPGVGAFGDGMANLRARGMVDALQRAVIDRGTPFLGVCLGMEFLAEDSDEMGLHRGLGWLPGRVTRIVPERPGFKIPHMGWNDVEILREAPLFENLGEAPIFYFVHSYAYRPAQGARRFVSATVSHGEELVAAVQRDNIYGVQFHPEKSQVAGISVLRNFLKASKVLADA